MNYEIRNAMEADFSVIEEIYARARAFMAMHHNPDQWGTKDPPRELLQQDITREKLYVICNATGIHGVFYFSIEEDPTYAVIENGNWHCGDAYGVIHRIAGDGSGGILKEAVAFAQEQIGYIRIDTHEDNYVMQNALAKQGFRRCGIIYVEDGTTRIAYDRLA